jgi:hypothetical protein
MATVIILSHVCLGKDSKPDRVLSVTSLERHEGTTDKPYKVAAKAWLGETSGREPTLYYKLACKASAADLEVGKLYQAAEMTVEGIKTLVIVDVTETDTTINGIACSVESVKTSDDSKR